MNTIASQNIDLLIEENLSRVKTIEKQLWSTAAVPRPSQIGDGVLEQYQAAYRQLEQLIALKGVDQRHEFVIIIPVADRPQHLQNCLDSLLHLCTAFAYGGFFENRFQKISVIIADDSKNKDNIAQHKLISQNCNSHGLYTLYFGLEQQLDQINELSEFEKNALARIIGNSNETNFYHKGSSIMRNIAYLNLNKIQGENVLFYFIDSDQEFQVKISTADGDKNLYACNYFFWLDRIFTDTSAKLVTGKVVGDPPVSPSVMAGNFLDDVILFLQQIARYDPSLPCQFHGTKIHAGEDAAYHDMSALFGFKPSTAPFQYHCEIKGEHDNLSCFQHFSWILSHFFYGEHPTRKTYYQHSDPLSSICPARTVYTGNYIFKPEVLKFFIPFASLKLRMAGPVLGRLLKSELKEQFLSANLPMLHNRTMVESGRSEFRSGIFGDSQKIDLAGEFERQFYGDVMLFSIEALITAGYPQQMLAKEFISHTVETTYSKLFEEYNKTRLEIAEKVISIKALISENGKYWNDANSAEANNNFKAFIANIEHNFIGHTAGYSLAGSHQNKQKRLTEIIENIVCYPADISSWFNILSK